MTEIELAELYARCFPDDMTHWSTASIEQLRRNHFSHIFESQNGALFLQLVEGEAEILSIFVAPEAKRQGEASDLLKTSINYAMERGVRSIFLEVAADNQAALKLYQKFEFQLMGKRKAYYARKNGMKIDALTLRLDL